MFEMTDVKKDLKISPLSNLGLGPSIMQSACTWCIWKSYSMHSLLLKTIPNFDKFIGQNFAESQTAPNLMVFLSPRSGTPCPVHPSCFTIPIHLIFFDK